MPNYRLLGLAAGLLLMTACASTGQGELKATEKVIDLPRFMGDWYVIASIPVTIPFFSEAGAHNGIESYALNEAGEINTTYTFRQDAFDGPIKRMRPKGFVYNQETNAEWRMQFLWPFRAAYLIAYVDDDYQTTIVGEPKRRYVWIMARKPEVDADTYQSLVSRAADMGYDLSKLERVPQRWPEDPSAPPR
jgi:apolipoprotein D and lipocalin family protein